MIMGRTTVNFGVCECSNVRQDFALARFRKSVGIWQTREIPFPVASTSTSNKVTAALQSYRKPLWHPEPSSPSSAPFLFPDSSPSPPASYQPKLPCNKVYHPLTPLSLTRTYDLISLKRPPQKSRPPYKIPFHRYRTTYTEQHHSNYPYTT
jgi:hypothetical protein